MKLFTTDEIMAIKAVFNEYYTDEIFTHLSPDLIMTNEEMGFAEKWSIYYGHHTNALVFANQDMTEDGYPTYMKHFSEQTTINQFCIWLNNYMIAHSYT